MVVLKALYTYLNIIVLSEIDKLDSRGDNDQTRHSSSNNVGQFRWAFTAAATGPRYEITHNFGFWPVTQHRGGSTDKFTQAFIKVQRDERVNGQMLLVSPFGWALRKNNAMGVWKICFIFRSQFEILKISISLRPLCMKKKLSYQKNSSDCSEPTYW